MGGLYKLSHRMSKHYTAYYSSEIGTIEIVGTRQGILSVDFVEEQDRVILDFHQCLEPCIHQLDEYFHGKLQIFTLPLLLRGTSFQKKVWNALIDIPYGTTQSYAEIARKIDKQNAFRAVGNANNKKQYRHHYPLSSCHRQRWKPYRICRRHLAKRMVVRARK